MATDLKPVAWIASSRRDLNTFPEEVQKQIGYALYEAQKGKKYMDPKPLRGFSGAGVLEVVENYDGDSFRAVYTVRFVRIVYVLHCFQKKSKSGIATPKQELDLVRQRLRVAEQRFREWQERKK